MDSRGGGGALSGDGISRSGGRPRDPTIDSAVLGAALGLLEERSYGRFALEVVAERAHTTKAAMRRRWPSRQQMIIDALATVLVVPPVPDTGCTRCDLTDSLELLFAALYRRVPQGVLPSLIAECRDDEFLRPYLHDTLIQPMNGSVAVAVTRASQRGDLHRDTSVDVLVEQLAAITYHRVLFGRPPPPEGEVVAMVDQILRGTAADFDELVRISNDKPVRHTHIHPSRSV